MIVGNFTAPLIMAFNDNMTRAISPPDATCATGWSAVLLLALKRKLTRSVPDAVQSPSLKSMANRTFGMPNGTSLCRISSSTLAAAFLLTWLSFLATARQSA